MKLSKKSLSRLIENLLFENSEEGLDYADVPGIDRSMSDTRTELPNIENFESLFDKDIIGQWVKSGDIGSAEYSFRRLKEKITKSHAKSMTYSADAMAILSGAAVSTPLTIAFIASYAAMNIDSIIKDVQGVGSTKTLLGQIQRRAADIKGFEVSDYSTPSIDDIAKKEGNMLEIKNTDEDFLRLLGIIHLATYGTKGEGVSDYADDPYVTAFVNFFYNKEKLTKKQSEFDKLVFKSGYSSTYNYFADHFGMEKIEEHQSAVNAMRDYRKAFEGGLLKPKAMFKMATEAASFISTLGAKTH